MGAFDDVATGRGNEEKFLVLVRLRPLNHKEIATNDVSDWECINDNTIIYKNDNFFVPDRSLLPTSYKFDRVFSPDCSTRQVYMEGVREVALSVVNGINSSVFAYGQTSSGKTFTMSGIAEYTIADIYDYIKKHMDREYLLKFSAMEIYNESVRDLLSTDSSPLRLLDDPERGTIVENLTEATLRDWNHVQELLSVCEAQRQIGETSLNGTSSRSHQIIRLTIESSARDLSGNDNPSTLIAAVDFVDLAGNERAFQSLSAGIRSKEGSHINRSLLTLGAVIRKLSKGRNGVPYRNSKLTRILQSSLGGNARTAIICTMSPARIHAEQSRNTLLFASRAKEVSTNAQVNVIISDKALVKHMQRELAKLERELSSPRSTFAKSKLSALLREKDLKIEKLEKEVKDLRLQRDAAKSEVHNLLQQMGDEQRLPSREGFSPYPHLRIHESPDSEQILQDRRRRFGTSQFSDEYSASSFSDSYAELPSINVFPHNDISNMLLISTSQFSESESIQDMDEFDDKSNDTFEDVTKEVTNSYFDPSCFSEDNTESSPNMTFKEVETECQKGVLPVSREYGVVRVSPLLKVHIENKPPKGFTGKVSAQNYGASSDGSDPPAVTTEIEHKACQQGTSTNADISSNAEMKNTTELQHDDHTSESVAIETEAESNGSLKSVKDVSLDPAEDDRPLEFKRLQREIIKLWDACNVSLLHRSHFFLLFKGDPSDCICMEIELQRLSFLKEKISHYNETVQDGQILTLASSAKTLVRERRMLSSQMQKQLSGVERQNLFVEWGVPLNGKNRRLQLANRLWTETEDMDHIARSANVVFKLVGPATREKKFREIFVLNFGIWGSKKHRGFRDGLSSML